MSRARQEPAAPPGAKARQPSAARAIDRAQPMRERLLSAARLAFEDVGFHPARIDDITRRAGVSHGVFYNYYASKIEIARALAARLDASLLSSMQELLDERHGAGLQDRLTVSIRRSLEIVRDQAGIIDVMLEIGRFDAEIGARRRSLHRTEATRLSADIRRLQQAGLLDRALDPEITAIAIPAMIWHFAEKWFLQQALDRDFEAGLAPFVRVCLNALGARSEAERADG